MPKIYCIRAPYKQDGMDGSIKCKGLFGIKGWCRPIEPNYLAMQRAWACNSTRLTCMQWKRPVRTNQVKKPRSAQIYRQNWSALFSAHNKHTQFQPSSYRCRREIGRAPEHPFILNGRTQPHFWSNAIYVNYVIHTVAMEALQYSELSLNFDAFQWWIELILVWSITNQIKCARSTNRVDGSSESNIFSPGCVHCC